MGCGQRQARGDRPGRARIRPGAAG